MKHNIIFLILIGMTCLFYTSCEKSGYQVIDNGPRDDKRISNREVEECEECPDVDDCCCAIEAQDPQDELILRLCGTSDGASACMGGTVGNCTVSTGGGQILFFDPSDYRKLFCMGPGNAFWIENLSGITADIYLTCQHDLTAPQILPISIPNGQKWFYSTNNACELTLCE